MGAANVVVGFADGSALMGVGMLKLLRQVLTMMLVSLGSGGGESGGGGWPLTGVCIWCFPLRDDRFLRVRRRAGMWFRKQQYPCQPVCLAPKRRRKAISLPSQQYLYIPLSGGWPRPRLGFLSSRSFHDGGPGLDAQVGRPRNSQVVFLATVQGLNRRYHGLGRKPRLLGARNPRSRRGTRLVTPLCRWTDSSLLGISHLTVRAEPLS